MKKTIASLLFISVFTSVISCDIACYFCHEFQANEFVFAGKILEKGEHFIKFEPFDVLRGKEHRAVITIWSGTDFDCNGTFSMAAEEMGEVGDSLLLSAFQIYTTQNEWDVLCDYRRTNFCIYQISNGGIGPFNISPEIQAPLAYSVFKQKWQEETFNNCKNYKGSFAACTDEEGVIVKVFPNPTTDKLYLQIGVPPYTPFGYKIYDVAGRFIQKGYAIDFNTEIDFSHFAKGVYILSVSAGGLNRNERIVVQ
ncbi:MAG: T9SS type A sorting domain-containing protein [Saprospiraceae bacterium]|nr:T9SS type A sorting domain-containing protein [Saprospiraceae bacterium]